LRSNRHRRNLGTRFIASKDAPGSQVLDEWRGKREEARRDRDRLKGEILATHQAGRPHETLLTAGQTAGGIKDILPVAEIIRRLVAEAEAALSRARDLH